MNAAWLAVAGAVGMATMGVFARYAAVDAPTITFYRLAIGALLVWLVTQCLQRSRWQMPAGFTLLSGGLLAGFIMFYVEAMSYTTMANAVITVYLAPPLAAFISHWLWREHLTLGQCLCIALALLGFAMVMEFQLVLTGQDLQGMFYAGLALLCYTAFMLLNRHTPVGGSPLQAVFWQMLVGALVMLVIAGPASLSVSATELPWMLGTGLIPGFLALTCTVLAMQRLSTAKFGTLAYSEPVAAIVFGWLLFSESLSLLQAGGCLLIVLAGIAQVRTGPVASVGPEEGVVEAS